MKYCVHDGVDYTIMIFVFINIIFTEFCKIFNKITVIICAILNLLVLKTKNVTPFGKYFVVLGFSSSCDGQFYG